MPATTTSRMAWRTKAGKTIPTPMGSSPHTRPLRNTVCSGIFAERPAMMHKDNRINEMPTETNSMEVTPGQSKTCVEQPSSTKLTPNSLLLKHRRMPIVHLQRQDTQARVPQAPELRTPRIAGLLVALVGVLALVL